MTSEIPLISIRSIECFSPSEYKAHIEAMYEDCPVRKAHREAHLPKVIFRWTKGGKPSVLVSKRKPKYITQTEFRLLCSAQKIPQNILFLYLKKRQIAVRPGEENQVTPDSLTARRSVGESDGN